MGKRKNLPDAAALRQRVEAYFAACDATAELIALKSGGVQRRQIPYTMAGLGAYVGLDQQQMRQLMQERHTGQAAREAGEVLRDAYRRVEGYLVDRALLGELNTAAVEAHLSRWREESEKEAEQAQEEGLRVILEDPEGWSR